MTSAAPAAAAAPARAAAAAATAAAAISAVATGQRSMLLDTRAALRSVAAAACALLLL
jgi:hypothetical protein